MKLKLLLANILSIVREALNNPNKNGLIMVMMIIILVILVLYIINRNNN